MTVSIADTGDSGVEVSIFQAEQDDAVVVQIDTYNTGLSRIRVNINDGTAYDQDVETGESFGDDLHVRVADLSDDDEPTWLTPGYALDVADIAWIKSLYVHPNEPTEPVSRERDARDVLVDTYRAHVQALVRAGSRDIPLFDDWRTSQPQPTES